MTEILRAVKLRTVQLKMNPFAFAKAIIQVYVVVVREQCRFSMVP